MQKGIVVITGATKGLGKALAHQFAKIGWKVAGCGRSLTQVNNLERELGKGHYCSAVDVSDVKAVDKWAEDVLEKFGAPDMLINNAGIINKNAPLWEISPSMFSQVMNINVMGSFYVLRAFIPALIKKGKGLLINMSSGWGREGEGLLAPYCASKFAIEGLTQSLARELPKKLSVVALDPGGGINTDMLKSCMGKEAANYRSPEECAQVAVPFLLRLDSKDNGKSLTVP